MHPSIGSIADLVETRAKTSGEDEVLKAWKSVPGFRDSQGEGDSKGLRAPISDLAGGQQGYCVHKR
jgi:hypothetical protein